MDARLRRALETGLGGPVTAMSAVRGGDVSVAYRVELADGRVTFAKTHASAPPGFFSTEADGLGWLREPGVMRVPRVLAVSDGSADADGPPGEPAYLALEWIDEGRPGPSTDTAFGTALAHLHRAGADCFGRADGRTTGSLALPNDPCDTWVEFYATRRLLPLARLAADAGALPHVTVAELERVAGRLDQLGGRPEPPARLHGDLWAGNRVVDSGGHSWLIDPAAHGGHREADLAMMRLFGGFGTSFDSYAAVTPLAAGWAERVALHQISPLVVHAIKFGGGYVTAARAAISRYA